MLIQKSNAIPPSEITPHAVWLQRRALLKAAMAAVGVGTGLALGGRSFAAAEEPPGTAEKIPNVRASSLSTDEPPTRFADVTGYNNFYEFGTDKADPKANAHRLRPRPWTLVVDGACEAPGEIGIEDILAAYVQEERIYRLRCVEAWAMVVPWIGFPLGDLLKRFKPTADARYVAFETLVDTKLLWLVKADLREPLIYAAVLAVLLVARVPWTRLGRPRGRDSRGSRGLPVTPVAVRRSHP